MCECVCLYVEWGEWNKIGNVWKVAHSFIFLTCMQTNVFIRLKSIAYMHTNTYIAWPSGDKRSNQINKIINKLKSRVREENKPFIQQFYKFKSFNFRRISFRLASINALHSMSLNLFPNRFSACSKIRFVINLILLWRLWSKPIPFKSPSVISRQRPKSRQSSMLSHTILNISWRWLWWTFSDFLCEFANEFDTGNDRCWWFDWGMHVEEEEDRLFTCWLRICAVITNLMTF